MSEAVGRINQMNLKSIRFSGYKSFSNAEISEIDVSPWITVLIGKNNCGKSSCIDILEYCLDSYKFIKEKMHYNTLIEPSFALTENNIQDVFPKDRMSMVWNTTDYNVGKKFENCKTYFKLTDKDSSPSLAGLEFSSIDSDIPCPFDLYHKSRLSSSFKSNLSSIVLRRINADRDIIPEKETDIEYVDFDGAGATNLIRKYLNHNKKDESLIEKTLLSELNKIMFPDAVFTDIKVQQVEDGDSLSWEIFLSEGNNRFALSKSGSGLKTIILTLLNLLVLPKTDRYKHKKIVYAFEELENNLHPALQKRLFNYLYEYAKYHNIHIVLTTHSHIAINTFCEKENTTIYHIVKNDGISSLHKIHSISESTAILDDLDVKASDLFQANGIIWVEGPSDKIYIEHWLKIFCNNKYIEGSHYQFLYYNGKNLAHYTTEESDNLINILKTNRNAAIVIDSDKRSPSSSINKNKARVRNEFKSTGMFCWITKGKEIENYLSAKSINDKYDSNYSQIGQYELFPDYIKPFEKNFESKKVAFAKSLTEYITVENSQDILDLKKQVESLYSEIEKWNK